MIGRYRKYSGFTDSAGDRWRGRKPDGWPNDSKCPDGYTCNGYRKVDGKGRIRFGGCYWADENWAPGTVVYVGLCDPFGAQIWTITVDLRFTPDSIGCDWPAFIRNSHETARQTHPKCVGDQTARKSK